MGPVEHSRETVGDRQNATESGILSKNSKSLIHSQKLSDPLLSDSCQKLQNHSDHQKYRYYAPVVTFSISRRFTIRYYPIHFKNFKITQITKRYRYFAPLAHDSIVIALVIPRRPLFRLEKHRKV
jgi:hypothetical protein